jgi:hypothetical protein
MPTEWPTTPASGAIRRAGALLEVVVVALVLRVMREAVWGVLVPVHDSILS